MPRRSLSLHPVSASPATGIEVDIVRPAPGVLRLRYTVRGDVADMIVPPLRPSARTDGLWQHSCFEVFFAAGAGYYEFNFSPSGQWAAYRFDGHRAGRRDAPTDDPVITWDQDGDEAELIATLPLPDAATGPLGLSAIIEDAKGGRSFWALAHPPGEPDFHDPACFAAQLPPAE